MKIVQLIDSLHVGGAERMAVNYANALAERGHGSFLWSTREEGILAETISPKVAYTHLNRKGNIGWRAVWQAKKILKTEGVQIIHAHSTSYFFGVLLKLLTPGVKLVWHDHYGNSEMLIKRPLLALKVLSNWFDTIFTVNDELQRWGKERLNCDKVYYIKNFIKSNKMGFKRKQERSDNQIQFVCVANFRPQKNHHNLLRALEILTESNSNYKFHLFGKNWNDKYFHSITTFINNSKFKNLIVIHQEKDNVIENLPFFDIGVLSSDSEGLPLALLEYAQAGLAVVCTDVGFCREVVQNHAKVVPPKDPKALAEALEFYLQQPDHRRKDAALLQKHVQSKYTEEAVIPKVLAYYQQLLQKD